MAERKRLVKDRDGVDALRAWLDRFGFTITEFCHAAGIPERSLYRVLSRRRGATVKLAAAIEDATDGDVRARWFADTRRPAKPGEASA